MSVSRPSRACIMPLLGRFRTTLLSRRFLPLFVTQALSALLDNLYRNAAVLLILFSDPRAGASLVPLAGLLFTLPFVLGSAAAGTIADSHDKAWLIRWNRVSEFALSLAAAAALIFGGATALLAVLFGFGVQACFFGPLKYAILPQLLDPSELPRGNGWVAAATFIAIVLGTLIGGGLVALPQGNLWAAAGCVLISATGLCAALLVPPAPPSGHAPVHWHVLRENRRLLAAVLAEPALRAPALGISWFWVLGSVMLAEVPVVAARNLAADATVATLLLTVVPVGLALGALLAGRFADPGRRLAFAAAGVSLFLLDFALATSAAPHWANAARMLADMRGWRLAGDLLAASVCGGIFVLPLNVALQARAQPTRRARVIGANNVLNALAIVGAGAVAAMLPLLGLSAPAIILLLALGNLVVAWGWWR